MDYLGLGREQIFLPLFICNYVVSAFFGGEGGLFLLVLGMGCIILLLHYLGFPYNYFDSQRPVAARAAVQSNHSSLSCSQLFTLDSKLPI